MIINGVLLAVLVICVITDVKNRKIYNKVIFPALLLAFIYHAAASGWEGLFHSFLGFLIGLGLLFIPYVLGGMGAGDVKLLALIGALKGGTFVFQSFMFIALLGGVMALILIIKRKGLFFLWTKSWGQNEKKEKILTATFPYGVAIAIGTCVNLFTEGMLF